MRPAVSLLIGMICAFFLCAGAIAQPAASGTVVSGIAVDSITQQPLASATVTVKETSKRTLTDADGRFSINIGIGQKTLVVGYTGYLAQRIAVSGSNDALHIALIRKSDPLKDVVVTSDLNPAHRIICLMQQHRR